MTEKAQSDRFLYLRLTLGDDLFKKVRNAKLLVVGAGGIGCELLKNLVLTGFQDLEIVDLDTIDKSNLNRQFLFRPHHVDKSKALMAKEAVLGFNPAAKIEAYYGNVKDARFGLPFIRKFDIVLNALDNVDARRHVNRLCLAEKKPLIESGTRGYIGQSSRIIDVPRRSTVVDGLHFLSLNNGLITDTSSMTLMVGQVTVIRKGETECFECTPKETPKVHPICTIRSTPSKPVHCIVWAKQMFCLMFGKTEESMLYEDPVTGQSAFMDQVLARPEEGASAAALASYTSGVLKALFREEILKQIGMDRYKGAERTPVPLENEVLEKECGCAERAPSGLRERGWDRKEWNEVECVRELAKCVRDIYRDAELRAKVVEAAAGRSAGLEFDKDNSLAMAFVTAASNLRSRVFQIPVQSLYEAKGIAGNIIPAIATTNAIVAGLQVMEALKILRADAPIAEACRLTHVLRHSTRKGLVLQPTRIEKPTPSCFVCHANTLELCLDTETWTLKDLVDRVFKQRLGINEPTVGMGATTLLEEGDDADERLEVNLGKLLKDLPGGGIKNGTSVEVEDYSQDLSVKLSVFHKTFDEEKVPEGFTITGDAPVASPQDNGQSAPLNGSNRTNGAKAVGKEGNEAKANGKDDDANDDDDDIVQILDDEVVMLDEQPRGTQDAPRTPPSLSSSAATAGAKTSHEKGDGVASSSKKRPSASTEGIVGGGDGGAETGGTSGNQKRPRT